MTYEDSLRIQLDDLRLPPDAIAWLLELWNLIQVFDDVADGDDVPRANLDRAIWSTLSAMPSNAFYQRWQSWLIPALSQAVLKWMASDLAERRGLADERSYMWRAGYYDVVCLVVSLVHGPSSEMAYRALSMYGEACAEYLKEFADA